jgi:cytochrome oxidase Cu insertion factor (SCO1/SenC/PrrC family)
MCSLIVIALWVAMGVGFATPQRPQQGDLKVGQPAPPFTLKTLDGSKEVSLAQLKGKPVVLIFGSCT